MPLLKYVFLDTNIFEQFQPIHDIDWPSVASCTSVALIIPPIVIRELNEHKDSASRGRLRRKADSTLKELHALSRNPTPIVIRQCVELLFEKREPLLDFVSYGLDEHVNDDRLIASAIAFAEAQGLPAETVLVATGDFGLQLKAEGQPRITCLPIPETYRLPAESDDEEKELRQLQRDLLQLRNTLPDLKLSFPNGKDFCEATIQAQLSHENRIAELIEKERKKYPFLQKTTPAAPAGWMFSLSGPEAIERYNRELETYFADYATWLQHGSTNTNWWALTLKLTLQLSNSGGAPARDAHIDLHFPDGFEVLGSDDLPEKAEKPEPPLRPEEELASRMRLSLPSLDFLHRPPVLGRRPNATVVSIKKSKSYDVRLEVEELKHTETETLPSVYIHFHAFDSAEGFQFSWRAVAANHPRPFSGALHVKLVRLNPIVK